MGAIDKAKVAAPSILAGQHKMIGVRMRRDTSVLVSRRTPTDRLFY